MTTQISYATMLLVNSIKDKPMARITEEEMNKRREALRKADAHNRIEGLFPDPATDTIFEAFIRGDIDYEELLPRLRAFYGK